MGSKWDKAIKGKVNTDQVFNSSRKLSVILSCHESTIMNK